jgi:hypothetical protein
MGSISEDFSGQGEVAFGEPIEARIANPRYPAQRWRGFIIRANTYQIINLELLKSYFKVQIATERCQSTDYKSALSRTSAF